MTTTTVLTILIACTGLIITTIGLTRGRKRFPTGRPSIKIDFDNAKRTENKLR